MPGYIAAALHRFQHPLPIAKEDSPHAWIEPTYGAPIQLAPLEDTSPRLDTEGTTRGQQIVGTLLYYARAVDSTMLVALGGPFFPYLQLCRSVKASCHTSPQQWRPPYRQRHPKKCHVLRHRS